MVIWYGFTWTKVFRNICVVGIRVNSMCGSCKTIALDGEYITKEMTLFSMYESTNNTLIKICATISSLSLVNSCILFKCVGRDGD